MLGSEELDIYLDKYCLVLDSNYDGLLGRYARSGVLPTGIVLNSALLVVFLEGTTKNLSAMTTAT